MSRRSFLAGLGAALAAPAIVHFDLIMPVKALVVPPTAGGLLWADEGDFYYSDEISHMLRTNVQPLMKFREFCDEIDLRRKALARVNPSGIFEWNRFDSGGAGNR